MEALKVDLQIKFLIPYIGVAVNQKLKWGDSVAILASKATRILHRNVHRCSKTCTPKTEHTLLLFNHI